MNHFAKDWIICVLVFTCIFKIADGATASETTTSSSSLRRVKPVTTATKLTGNEQKVAELETSEESKAATAIQSVIRSRIARINLDRTIEKAITLAAGHNELDYWVRFSMEFILVDQNDDLVTAIAKRFYKAVTLLMYIFIMNLNLI